MNQKTLYLKYRPLTLDQVVGQDDVVNVLKNSVKSDKLSHAYLFSGSRGTGKTTTARAFANELGIHKDDILELDAASNNGVEEIKAITESVYTLPYFGKYKMYILDEAHMLTKAASNAFLKTLEEPPAHVIFVMCTTDPEKMLETVLSRCVKFGLKSPTEVVLAKFLEEVCKKESVKMDKEAIQLVALSGAGSFRDSLSNLQKVLSYDLEKFTEKEVSKVLGVAPTTLIFDYLKSLDGLEEAKLGIETIKQLEQMSVDPRLFSKEVTYYARLIILFRHKLITENEVKAEYGEHVYLFVEKFTQNLKKENPPKLNSLILAKLITAEIDSKNSSFPFLPYELLLM